MVAGLFACSSDLPKRSIKKQAKSYCTCIESQASKYRDFIGLDRAGQLASRDSVNVVGEHLLECYNDLKINDLDSLSRVYFKHRIRKKCPDMVSLFGLIED